MQINNPFLKLSRRLNETTERPILSIVVICFNMQREAPRTLYSLSPSYQENVSAQDYQIIVLDNGSPMPLNKDSIEQIAPNIEYHYFDTQSQSPAAAINFGASIATGRYIGFIVDGARMVTPNTINYCLMACRSAQNPYVTSLAWHLGPKEQNESMLDGYNQEEEDKLLESIKWENNGYRLFEISSQASSSSMGFLGGLPYESSFFVMKKEAFFELGGFDERFQSPGGGLVNHAFLDKIIEIQNFDCFVLLGEGSFHQFHGGVATNAEPSEHPIHLFMSEYEDIYGNPYQPNERLTEKKISYLGGMHETALRFMTKRTESE